MGFGRGDSERQSHQGTSTKSPGAAPPGQADPPFWPASLVLPLDVRQALPQVTLARTGDTTPWTAVADLLGSGPTGHTFIVETEHDGRRAAAADHVLDAAGDGRRLLELAQLGSVDPTSGEEPGHGQSASHCQPPGTTKGL